MKKDDHQPAVEETRRVRGNCEVEPRRKKAVKKKFLESSRLQFRNNSRYDVTPALKWKPSARSSRRRRCYYSAKVKIMPVVCGAASLPRGRNAFKVSYKPCAKIHMSEMFCKVLRSDTHALSTYNLNRVLQTIIVNRNIMKELHILGTLICQISHLHIF